MTFAKFGAVLYVTGKTIVHLSDNSPILSNFLAELNKVELIICHSASLMGKK